MFHQYFHEKKYKMLKSKQVMMPWRCSQASLISAESWLANVSGNLVESLFRSPPSKQLLVQDQLPKCLLLLLFLWR